MANYLIGTSWSCTLCNRCLDLSKPSRICCMGCPYWAWKWHPFIPSWCIWASRGMWYIVSLLCNTNNISQLHTGVAIAIAFQNMLEWFELNGKILTFNADNVTSNDTQMTKLDALNNSFDKENWVQCFNHTLQLSAKSLLKPFNTTLSRKAADNDDMAMHHSDISQTILEDNEGDGDGDADKNEDSENLQDDNINELQEQILETAAVHMTVTKVRFVKQRAFTFCLLII